MSSTPEFQSLAAVIFSYGLFSILLGITAGSIMFVTLTSFPVNIRFSGSCISFNLSMSIFGGTAPLLALYLSSRNQTAPAYLLIITAILATFSALSKTTRSKDSIYDNQVSTQNG